MPEPFYIVLKKKKIFTLLKKKLLAILKFFIFFKKENLIYVAFILKICYNYRYERKLCCASKKYEVMYMQTEKIGERIRYLRMQNGITQKELAKNLYVSGKTVSSWELNRTEPDIASIIKISLLFCISLDYLLIGKTKNTL